MFGNKLATAKATIDRLTALLATIGFAPAAAEADPTALKTFVDGLTAKAAQDAIAASQALVTTANQAKDAAIALSATLTTGLKDAGVIVPDGAALTPASVKSAIETSVGAKAAQTIAGAGHDPLPLPAAGTTAAETVDSLRERLATETDPRRKGELCARISSLRAKSDPSRN